MAGGPLNVDDWWCEPKEYAKGICPTSNNFRPLHRVLYPITGLWWDTSKLPFAIGPRNWRIGRQDAMWRRNEKWLSRFTPVIRGTWQKNIKTITTYTNVCGEFWLLWKAINLICNRRCGSGSNSLLWQAQIEEERVHTDCSLDLWQYGEISLLYAICYWHFFSVNDTKGLI